MSKKIKAGLVGVGSFGMMHLAALRSIEELEISAVCDLDDSLAQKAARDYGVKSVYTDYNEMFSQSELDFVCICTPESKHKEPAISAMERGIHVLVEKPIATSLEDAHAMTTAAGKYHVSIMVGHILRWDPRYAAVKEMVDSDQLGRIGAMFARRTTFRRLATTYLTRVGVFPVLAIHDIDLMLWYTKDRVKECRARSASILGKSFPDTAVGSLEFMEGTKAAFMFSFATPKGSHGDIDIGNRFEILSDKSFTVIDTSQQSLQVTDGSGLHPKDTTFTTKIGDNLLGSLRNEIAYFAHCVKNSTEVKMATGKEATEALKVALACQRSAQEGKPVRVN